MVDCWMQLGIRPYQHLICQTPLFRLLLGITEYIFRRSEFLDQAIDAAINCKEIRADDLEFYRASISWAELIHHKNMDGYKKKFEEISEFFGTRIHEAKSVICLDH
jgi:prephenate dehydrogenase (NADP+)